MNKSKRKVMLYDPDIYGRHAINSYLAWDRRTRVVCLAPTIEYMFEWLTEHIEVEWPDVAILDTCSFFSASDLKNLIFRLRQAIPSILLILLDRELRLDYAMAALDTHADAYFLRNDVGLQVAWAVVWALRPEFAISSGIKKNLPSNADERLHHAVVLPEQRQYPELTERIRQAIKLCVVEGMSAELAADEMGVSTHTIRSYIKEGYRILEAYDNGHGFPPEMSAQERAFMRFTALSEDELPKLKPDDESSVEDR